MKLHRFIVLLIVVKRNQQAAKSASYPRVLISSARLFQYCATRRIVPLSLSSEKVHARQPCALFLRDLDFRFRFNTSNLSDPERKFAAAHEAIRSVTT